MPTADLTGELVIRFFANGHIELDDAKAQKVTIGDLYKAGLMLCDIGDVMNSVDKLAIDNDRKKESWHGPGRN